MPSGRNVVDQSIDYLRHLPRVSLANIGSIAKAGKKSKCRRGDGRRANRHDPLKGPRQAYFAIGSECKKNPFFMRFPKENYYANLAHKREYPPLSLLKLQKMIDLNRLDTSKPIDLAAISKTRLYYFDPSLKQFGINLTDEGADIFQAKINLEVQWASEAAVAAIEKNGGSITTAYYDIKSLHILKDPKKFFEKGESIPRRLPPPDDAVMYYSGAENRGYLADPEEVSWQRLVLAQKFGYTLPKIEEDPEFEMLTARKDPRQIFYGLEPGWVVNLKNRVILKCLDPTVNEFFKS